jgi:flavin reductase (DIM6/NTAB) family NADH-FMN oxidoreductase RutF
LEHSITLGGVDEQPGTDLIIGKVLQYHMDETITFGDKKIDPNKLKAVSRLAGMNYAKIGDIFPIERPK